MQEKRRNKKHYLSFTDKGERARKEGEMEVAVQIEMEVEVEKR